MCVVGECRSMAFSSGARNSAQLVAGWCVAAALAVGLVTHFEDVRTALGLKLDAADFGVAADAGNPRQSQQAASGRSGERSVEIRANSSGHYETRAHVNGRPIEVMVDTGATVVALTWE